MELNGIGSTSDIRTAAVDPPAATAPTADQTRERELRTQLADNPQAVQALDQLVRNRDYGQLGTEQKVQSLDAFARAPNAATSTYLQGAADTSRPAGNINGALTPDAGTLTMGGQTYTIDHGTLTNAQGQNAGTIYNDGTVQLRGSSGELRSVYDDINTRVQLQEQIGGRTTTLLDLHPADPNSHLANANLNPDVATRAEAVLNQVRREGMDMRVSEGYRTMERQNELYAQGRTAPGSIVTGQRAGGSWHNYGVAVDMIFNDARGQPSWPDAPTVGSWARYGEIAVGQGMEWGGNWRGFTDRPHIEYHPGFDAGGARGLLNSYNQGGLEAAWDRMGIGRVP